MRVYLKRKVSEVIAGGDVLKVKLEKTANGEKPYVDCEVEEYETLQSMGMVDAEPTPEVPEILEEAPVQDKSATESEEETQSTETPIKELELRSNVHLALRRKYKTVEALDGATIEDLTAIKGIGKRMAQTILETAAQFE